MDLSFQEKSLWLLFVSLILIFGLYFASILPAESVNVPPHQVLLFVALIVLLVVLQIVGNSALAIVDRRHDTDERHQLIELKGTRNGSYVVAAGVFLSTCFALFAEGNFLFTHVLLGFWVLAQLVQIGSQLLLYRRGP